MIYSLYQLEFGSDDAEKNYESRWYAVRGVEKLVRSNFVLIVSGNHSEQIFTDSEHLNESPNNISSGAEKLESNGGGVSASGFLAWAELDQPIFSGSASVKILIDPTDHGRQEPGGNYQKSGHHEPTAFIIQKEHFDRIYRFDQLK